jgi:hypothetical protein
MDLMIFLTAIPLAPPVTPPTIAWDVAVLIVVGGILAYKAIKSATATTSTATATSTAECPRRPCPPCSPPVGTVGYSIDRVPPSGIHWPCPGDHVHWLLHQQNPNNCQCFWMRDFLPVTCLPQGGNPVVPPGAVPL